MSSKVARAKFGSEAQNEFKGALPLPFPRTMGPNTLKYLSEVVESGLTTDMVGRFETTFTKRMGLKHCIGTPGCTAALSVLAAALEFAPGDEIV